LGCWEALRGPELRADARNPRLVEEAARNQRGRLLDRNGEVLAESIKTGSGLTRRYADAAASPVTGYFSPRYGSAGIEAAFDRELRGERSPDLPARLLADLTHRQPVGSDVLLTIDDRLQRAAASALGQSRGAIVALDPKT